MKALGIAALLMLLVIGGVTVAYWFNYTKGQLTMREEPSALNTPSESVGSPVASPTLVTSATPSWVTYTDPKWHYSIQYPSYFGVPVVNYYPDSAEPGAPTDNLSLGWPGSPDDLDVSITPIVTSTRVALAELPQDLKNQGSVVVDGFGGTLSGDPYGDESVILNSTPTPYYIGFEYFGNNNNSDYESLPSIWRQILESFRVGAND